MGIRDECGRHAQWLPGVLAPLREEFPRPLQRVRDRDRAHSALARSSRSADVDASRLQGPTARFRVEVAHLPGRFAHRAADLEPRPARAASRVLRTDRARSCRDSDCPRRPSRHRVRSDGRRRTLPDAVPRLHLLLGGMPDVDSWADLGRNPENRAKSRLGCPTSCIRPCRCSPLRRVPLSDTAIGAQLGAPQFSPARDPAG